METLKKMTDEELVIAYSKGNNQAFDMLLGRYEQKVYSYIYFIVRSNDLADDIFQETFVKAITTIRQGRYREKGKFGAWITRIAHNLIIDYFRQERIGNVLSNDEREVDLLNNIQLAENTIEHAMIEDQIRGDIRKLIKQLPVNQQEVVYLRFYKGLSFQEIAEITNVSINTSLGRMRYAILNLRKMVDKHGIALSVY